VAEATGMIDLSSWPDGSRLIVRRERPHPGAQLTFTDIDGMRVTALLTNTPAGVVPFQAAGLELRQRQHARVEDRILLLGPAGLSRDVARAGDVAGFCGGSPWVWCLWLVVIHAAQHEIGGSENAGFPGEAAVRGEVLDGAG
jgi:hypothetical protein